MADFVAMRGSTSRSLEITIQSSNEDDEFGTISEVVFFMRKIKNTVNKINGKPVAVYTVSEDRKTMDIRYDWDAEDVNEAGDFEGYVRVKNSNNKTDRFPADEDGDYITVKFTKSFEA